MRSLRPSGCPAARGAALRSPLAMLGAVWALSLGPPALADNTISTIERVKGSVVAIGTFQQTRAAAFQFRATGLAGGGGSVIATNAHALPVTLDSEHKETLVVLIPAEDRRSEE